MYADFTSTPIFDRPALRYPAPRGGIDGEVEITLHLTSYRAPSRAPKTAQLSLLPNIGYWSQQTGTTDTNLAWGGSAIAAGASELPKIVMEGFIQTPTKETISATGEKLAIPLFYRKGIYATPVGWRQAVPTDTFNMTWAEYIVSCLEGRSNMYGLDFYERMDPLWFRDPYGRVFTNPRVIDFTANFVEGVPGRNTFTMTLQI